MIIPIGDDNPRTKFPYVTYGLIAVNTIVYIYFGLIHGNYRETVDNFGFTPSQFNILTLFTSLFLHNDPLHLIFNMLFLWIYGDNVEAKFGRVRFLLFYLTSGVIAHGLQTALSTNLTIPNIGASGAIAGVLGAYLILFPRAKIIFWYFYIIMFRIFTGKFRVPAWLVLGVWFVEQLVSAYLGLAKANSMQGGVAFFAHVGGFLSGVLVMLLFRELYRFQRTQLLHPVIVDLPELPGRFTSDQWKEIHRYQKQIKETLLKQGTPEGVPLYEQLVSQYPETTVDPDSSLQLAESYTRRKEYQKALTVYEKLLKLYPHSDKADNALWCMAGLYREQLHQPEKADQCLQIIIDAYPLSEWYNPSKFALEEQGEKISARPYLQTVTKLGFAGRQIQFTGPVLIGLIVAVGTMGWMSSTLPHKQIEIFGFTPLPATLAESATPVWSANFDSGDLNQWQVKFPKDELVKLGKSQYVTAPYSLQFSREKESSGEIHPAEIESEKIPLDFTQPYTLSFDIFTRGIMFTQQIEFGQIALEFMIIRMPVIGATSKVRYQFGEKPYEFREMQRKGRKPFTQLFLDNQWNHLELVVEPNKRTFTIRVNQKEWETGLFNEHKKASPTLRLQNYLTQMSKNEEGKPAVYFDNFAVYGTKAVQPEVGAKVTLPETKPVILNPAYTEVYQQGWNQFRTGEYYSALTSFQQSVNLNPQSPEAHNALGLAERKTGNEALAVAEFNRALQLDPSFTPAKNNLETLTTATPR